MRVDLTRVFVCHSSEPQPWPQLLLPVVLVVDCSEESRALEVVVLGGLVSAARRKM